MDLCWVVVLGRDTVALHLPERLDWWAASDDLLARASGRRQPGAMEDLSEAGLDRDALASQPGGIH